MEMSLLSRMKKVVEAVLFPLALLWAYCSSITTTRCGS
jgi:hypothetical protein